MRLLDETLDTIWKYEIPTEDEFILVMPKGSVPLSVGVQEDAAVLWAAVSTQATEEERHRFFLRGTGHPFPELLANRFVGTCQWQIGGRPFVLHLFDGGPDD